MRAETMPGTTNVVRFPVERRARPTLTLLLEVAPDVREVMAIAEAFDLDMPPLDLREYVDAAIAEHLLNHAPAGGPEREAVLALTADPVLEAAIAACRRVFDLAGEAFESRRSAAEGQAQGGYWHDQLAERANGAEARYAAALVLAYTRTEEAFGVARAVDLARRCIPWTTRSFRTDAEALFG